MVNFFLKRRLLDCPNFLYQIVQKDLKIFNDDLGEADIEVSEEDFQLSEDKEEDDDDEESKYFKGSKLIKGSFQKKLHKWTQQKKNGNVFIEHQRMVLVLQL
jgi:hypothetical protein